MSNKQEIFDNKFNDCLSMLVDGKGQSFAEIESIDLVDLVIALNENCNQCLIALDTPAVRNNVALTMQINQKYRSSFTMFQMLKKQLVLNFVENILVDPTPNATA